MAKKKSGMTDVAKEYVDAANAFMAVHDQLMGAFIGAKEAKSEDWDNLMADEATPRGPALSQTLKAFEEKGISMSTIRFCSQIATVVSGKNIKNDNFYPRTRGG